MLELNFAYVEVTTPCSSSDAWVRDKWLHKTMVNHNHN